MTYLNDKNNQAQNQRGYASDDREQTESTTERGYGIAIFLPNNPQQAMSGPISYDTISKYQERP